MEISSIYLELKWYKIRKLLTGFWSTMGWSGRKSGFFLQMETLESFNRKSLLYLILSFLTGEWCCCSLNWIRNLFQAASPALFEILTDLSWLWGDRGYEKEGSKQSKIPCWKKWELFKNQYFLRNEKFVII